MNTNTEILADMEARRLAAGGHRANEMMISYAQNAEDVLLRRLFPADHVGFYIDVGANHPTTDSVTRHFYDRGWHGINVEPTRHFHKLLSADRPRDTNLLLGISCGDAEATFYETKAPSGLSTFSREQADLHAGQGIGFRKRPERLITLATLCEEQGVGEIDFLSIDAEGLERQVLEGADFGRWRPVAIVVEATRPNTPEPNHADWEPLVLEAGYRYAAFDGLGRYYIRDEDAHLAERLTYPACVFDNFVPYRFFVWHREMLETKAMFEELVGIAWPSRLWRGVRRRFVASGNGA